MSKCRVTVALASSLTKLLFEVATLLCLAVKGKLGVCAWTHTHLFGRDGWNVLCVFVCLHFILTGVSMWEGRSVQLTVWGLTFSIFCRAATCPLLFAPVWRTRVNELSPQRGKQTLHFCAECPTNTVLRRSVVPCLRLLGVMNSSFLYDKCQLAVTPC